MKPLEILGKLLLLLVFPTPKNIKELLGLLNAAIAESWGDREYRYSEREWREFRRMRNARRRK
jgi:hypothetical protein